MWRLKWIGYIVPPDRNANADFNNRRNVNANNRPQNASGMILPYTNGIYWDAMKTYSNMYQALCSYENLRLAFQNARKRKTLKNYVIQFESDLENNLMKLKHELETLTYHPEPLTTFIVRDPKTRTISASHFRDRVIHHALCNIIAPILEKDFIYDSFANQKGKGTHAAVKRYEYFLKKISSEPSSMRGGGNQDSSEAKNQVLCP